MKFSKLLTLVCVGLLSITLVSGCTINKNGNNENTKEFDAFIDELPSRLTSSDNMNLEFLFEQPENYGFTTELLTLPYSDKEDYEESEKETEVLLAELEEFNYDVLDANQKITYDILQDSFTRSLGAEEFYYLDNTYLGSFIGFQAQLPLLLNEYTFESEHDLNSYFHLLETSPEMFLKYGEIEKERNANNAGMNKAILDKVIDQCITFGESDNSFMVEAINEKIDALEFLSDSQKAAAKTRNQDLVVNHFSKAYLQLADVLKTIDAPEEEVGLASFPKGKEYYEYILQKTTGIDDSVEDIQKYLKKKQTSIMLEMQAIMRNHPEVTKQLMETDLENVKFSDFTTFEETIDYLGKRMKEDYPDAGALHYDITIVPDSMKDNFSPAAYLQGKIDAPIDSAEHIWVNGSYNQNLFETLAHEGYPGHMYQHSYFKQQNLPTVRYLIDYNGYSEGWATYIEHNVWQYADVDENQKVLLQLVSLNAQYSKCIIALMDIRIHYDGITFDEYTKEMNEEGFSLPQEDLKEQWYLFLETPTNYLQYYLTGFKYQDLQVKAKKELGDAYDNISFHEVLLKNGPMPYALLEKEVDAYITSTK